MMRWTALILVAGVATAAMADDLSTDRTLLAQAAALQGDQAAPPPEASAPQTPQAPGEVATLDAAERQARAEANLALAKLQLIQARKALKTDNYELAAQKAQQAIVLLRQVPPEVDVQEFQLQAEGVLARAARHGVDIRSVAIDAQETAPLTPEDRQLDRQVQAAAKISRQYSGPARPDIDSSGDARRLRERTLRRQMPDSHGYRPGRVIIDTNASQAWSEQSLAYQGALHDAERNDEVRMLVSAEEARLVPNGVVTYPPDWPERVARRQKYAGGVIARTPSWTDSQGREWYMAIYDIHDLIYVPPDFGLESQFFGNQFSARNVADRAALRESLFNGLSWGYVSPEEAIPLLRYFGGVNAWIDRGPKYSREREQEIVNMIRAFVGGVVVPVSEAQLPPEPPALPPEPGPLPPPPAP